MASLIVASFQSTQKVKVNNADTLPNFAKAVPMQPEQKKRINTVSYDQLFLQFNLLGGFLMDTRIYF